MNELTDVLLRRPVPDALSRWMMFFLVYAHLLLILILIGVVMVGVHHFLHSYWTKDNFEHRWDKKAIKKAMIPKSLGVAIGVLLLLVVQLYYAVPFFTATSMFAPFWLWVIVIMIGAFLMTEYTAHKMDVHPHKSLVFGVLGLILTLAIPAVFVLIMVTMENSDQWVDITQRGFHLPADLALHWLFRYLHVIGASMVFGAAFLDLVTSEGHEYRRRVLIRWIVIGILVQFLTGAALSLTLQKWVDPWNLVPAGISILSAIILLWLLYSRATSGRMAYLGRSGYVLLLITLGGMLLTRQFLQQQKVLPLLSRLDANVETYRASVDSLRSQQLASYDKQVRTVRDDGAAIYSQSCAFCHGRTGLGDGEEEKNLLVPPERLVFIRANRAYVREQVMHGVPGTAMPYFTIYEKRRFDRLLDYLGSEFHMYDAPDSIPMRISAADRRAAHEYYFRYCATCHGVDGSGGDYARHLSPPPPDFRSFSVQPARAMEVITNGYPGTGMPSFAYLPLGVRWALVQQVYTFRNAASVVASARASAP